MAELVNRSIVDDGNGRKKVFVMRASAAVNKQSKFVSEYLACDIKEAVLEKDVRKSLIHCIGVNKKKFAITFDGTTKKDKYPVSSIAIYDPSLERCITLHGKMIPEVEGQEEEFVPELVENVVRGEGLILMNNEGNSTISLSDDDEQVPVAPETKRRGGPTSFEAFKKLRPAPTPTQTLSPQPKTNTTTTMARRPAGGKTAMSFVEARPIYNDQYQQHQQLQAAMCDAMTINAQANKASADAHKAAAEANKAAAEALKEAAETQKMQTEMIRMMLLKNNA